MADEFITAQRLSFTVDNVNVSMNRCGHNSSACRLIIWRGKNLTTHLSLPQKAARRSVQKVKTTVMAAKQHLSVTVHNGGGKYGRLRGILPDNGAVAGRHRIKRPTDAANVHQVQSGIIGGGCKQRLLQAAFPERGPRFRINGGEPAVQVSADNTPGGGQGAGVQAALARLYLGKTKFSF